MTDSLDDLNAEDLDCLRVIGLRFVNRSDVFADISAEIQREEQAELMMSALGAGNAFKPPANPAPAKPRRQRKPSLRKMIAAAERDGKIVTSITTPDGVISARSMIPTRPIRGWTISR